MATIIIKSENPNLSYILGKNPNSIPVAKRIRKGLAVGWFHDQAYCINFKDSKTEISFQEYQDQEYEYLTISGINSALAYNSMIKEFFQLNKYNELDKDNEYKTLIIIDFINIKKLDYAKMIAKYYSDIISIDIVEKSVGNYQLTITSNIKIVDLFSISYLMLFLISMKNGDNIDMNGDLKKHYIELMTRTNAPYFVRYIFKSNFMVNGNAKELELLSKSDNIEMKLTPGNLLKARHEFIRNNFDLKQRDIVDLGCGEGKYAFYLAEKTKFDVHAIDIDPERIEYIERKIKNTGTKNIITYDSIDTFLDSNNEPVDVLCTEMIEHLESIDYAKDFVAKILNNEYVQSLILTTPNKDFNQFYKISDDDSRHDDHKFELTESEYKDFCNDVMLKLSGNYELVYHNIGDSVNDITPTQLAYFKKK